MKKSLLALVAILCFSVAAFAADISGKWTVDASAAPAAAPAGGGRGMGASTYEFKADGDKLTGSITRQGRGGEPTTTPITDGKVTADSISFTVTQNFGGNEFKTTYTGKIAGDKIELTFDMGGRGNPRTVTLKKGQ